MPPRISTLFVPEASNPIPSLLPLLTSPFATLSDLQRAHALTITSGALLFLSLSRPLLRLSIRLCLPYAVLLHSSFPRADPLASNILIKSLVRLSPFSVISFFCRHCHPIGIRPSPCNFPRIITAAKLSAVLPLGESLHSLALKLGFLSYIPISNSFIHLYASSDALDLSRQLFDEMPDRDPVSYNSLIDGYVKNRDLDEAEKLFWSAPDRSVVTWSCLFNGFVRNRMFRRGMDFYSKMRVHSVEPDDTTVVTLLMLYAHYKYALLGKSVHGYLLRRWSHLPIHVSSTLIDLYCNCGLLDAAAALFDRMEKKDLICWNTFIAGLGSQGRGKMALDVFEQMVLNGMKPNDVTFISVLVACAHSGLVEEGIRYFEMMSSRFGIKPSFAHHWCLVDLYVRIGSPSDAMRIIQGMPLDNLSAVWGAVISLARIHGDISVGECLGKKLIDLEPDNYRRYVPLANVYVAASQWDKYRELMQLMKVRQLKKLPECTLIDLNTVVHKFSVGDESQPDIANIYEVLEETAKQLKLQPQVESESLECVHE